MLELSPTDIYPAGTVITQYAATDLSYFNTYIRLRVGWAFITEGGYKREVSFEEMYRTTPEADYIQIPK
jgi:hypothetical protein